MEELQKVLEEQTSNTDDWFRKNVADDEDVQPGTESGQTKSPYVKNKDRELDLGDTTFTVKKGSGLKFDKRVYDLQQDINATGQYKLVPDGKLGPETVKALRKLVYWRDTAQSIIPNIPSIRGQLKGIIADYMRQTADKAAGPAGKMGYAQTKLASDLSGKASETSASPKKGPLPTKTMTPEEEKELMRVKPLNLNRESIVRELEKLLKNT